MQTSGRECTAARRLQAAAVRNAAAMRVSSSIMLQVVFYCSRLFGRAGGEGERRWMDGLC